MFIRNWNSKGRKILGIVASLNSIFGLWPEEEDNVSLRIRVSITALGLVSIILTLMYNSWLNCFYNDNNAEGLYSIIFGMIGLSKVFFYYKHRDILRSNVESAVEDWASEDSENFSSIMYSCRSNYKKFTQYFFTVTAVMTVWYSMKFFFLDPDVIIIVKIVKDGQNRNVTNVLPRWQLPVACVFNNVSQSQYWTIVLFQGFQIFVLFGLTLCPDGFIIAITSHLCAQFEVLKIKFTRCLKLNDPTETREQLSILIARHKHLLKLAKQLETTFSMIVFTQMIMNILLLNVAGFNFLVLLKKKQFHSALTNGCIIMFELVQTFMYSYIGDRLTSQGDDIAQSVYDSEWYSLPKNVSRDVIFITMRSRFPIGLTAGGFFKMTRSTFTDIVKTAVSYLSVLRIIIKDDI